MARELTMTINNLRRATDFIISSPDDLKRLYVEAAIFTYQLHSLSKYINRANDIVLVGKDYFKGEGAVMLGGMFFVPKRIIIEYAKKNRQN